MRRKHPRTRQTASVAHRPAELPTFLEHVYELRRRLFWIVATILIASSAAYPLLDRILRIVTAPLGNQQLYYLTPIGGFSFGVKICMYVGITAAIPLMVYHLYRYLEPLMNVRLRRAAFWYICASSLLAALGILFAYYVSLPNALHFLTSTNIDNIQAMLTADSYLTFVTAYLLGAAVLFQIPLLLLIIDTAKPLKPQKLMKSQRYVVVGAFIAAAVISPTPDIINQLFLALPIIGMYQIGIVAVWLRNTKRRQPAVRPKPAPVSLARNTAPYRSQPAPQAPAVVASNTRAPSLSLDGMRSVPSSKNTRGYYADKPRPAAPPARHAPNRIVIEGNLELPLRARSLDGLVIRRANQMATARPSYS